MCVFCEMKNVIEVLPYHVHFLEVPKLLKTIVTPLEFEDGPCATCATPAQGLARGYNFTH